MTSDASSEPRVQIAHVLTMDVVAYSTLLITEQTRIMARLTEIVKATPRFLRAEAHGKLSRLPTGDGMFLVFFDDPQAPVECAMEIARALKKHPEIRLRMGIHSGPVHEIVDVNERANVAGAGVDLAQRVMDCGDAGHILLSKRVADDLAAYPRWNPYLHDLGEREVKHGRKLAVVNFYGDDIGNPAVPAKREARHITFVGAILLAIAIAIAASVFLRTKSSPQPATSQSIAVLPFENPSNDPSVEYLAEGISEALINSLTELQQLRVIARSTAFHYRSKDADPRRVGRELQVAAVLTGKVRQMRDALSVQVDLVDTATGAQLWGAGYERKISDVVAVKQAIAREVTEKLKLRLSGEEERRLIKRDTTNAEAYQFYLRGRYFWNKRTPGSIKLAIEQFEQAIERDANFALGYAGLADSYILLQQYVGIPSSEVMPKARAAADRALQIDDSLAEAHTSSGMIHQFTWQWAQAGEEFRRALKLNDNYATAHHWFSLWLQVNGRWDEALKEIKRAQELDPLSPIIGANLVILLLNTNQIDAAMEQCRKIVELDPNHVVGHDWLGWIHFKQGNITEAIREREKVAELSQRAAPQISGVAYLYALTGRRAEALGILEELKERYARREAVGQSLAAVYEGLGERDEAFAWLEKDFEQRSAELQFLTIRVQFETLRRDPRYLDLIRRMGLPPGGLVFAACPLKGKIDRLLFSFADAFNPAEERIAVAPVDDALREIVLRILEGHVAVGASH